MTSHGWGVQVTAVVCGGAAHRGPAGVNWGHQHDCCDAQHPWCLAVHGEHMECQPLCRADCSVRN